MYYMLRKAESSLGNRAIQNKAITYGPPKRRQCSMRPVNTYNPGRQEFLSDETNKSNITQLERRKKLMTLQPPTQSNFWTILGNNIKLRFYILLPMPNKSLNFRQNIFLCCHHAMQKLDLNFWRGGKTILHTDDVK